MKPSSGTPQPSSSLSSLRRRSHATITASRCAVFYVLLSMRIRWAFENRLVLPHDGRRANGVSSKQPLACTIVAGRHAIFRCCITAASRPEAIHWCKSGCDVPSDDALQSPGHFLRPVQILLPDARVFNGGGGLCGDYCPKDGTNHFDGEIFSPPYLFNADGSLATRPSIVTAPGRASGGTQLLVTTNTPVTAFSLIRVGCGPMQHLKESVPEQGP